MTPAFNRRCRLGAAAATLGIIVLFPASIHSVKAHEGELADDGCHQGAEAEIRHCHSNRAAESESSLSNALPLPSSGQQGTSLEGLVIAPEHRCSRYYRDDYPYPSSIEKRIIAAQGGIYSPYTDETFASRRETDIEHIVALSEAHDSGMCSANADEKRRFSQDLDNLTLAAPNLNRGVKQAKDAAEWLPPRNRCWYVGRIIKVKRKYGLTVDRREAEALRTVVDSCK